MADWYNGWAALCRLAVWCSLLGAGALASGEPAHVGGESRTVAWAFPTGDVSTSKLLLENIQPSGVASGVPYRRILRLTNLSDCPLFAVTMTERLQPTIRLVASDPQAETVGEEVVWRLGTLPIKGTLTVTTTMMPGEVGEFDHCLTVDYVLGVCSGIRVVAARLDTAVRAPAEALLCDPIPLTVVVSNPGSATLAEVRVAGTLGDGLTLVGGGREIAFTLPELRPDQRVERQLEVTAERTGDYRLAIVASAGNLTAEASTAIAVRQPRLTAAVTAAETQYAGRHVAYRIVVGNTGDAPAEALTIACTVPEGMTFVEADSGGTLTGGTVVWRVPALAVRQQATVNLTGRADRIGAVTAKVRATARCAEPAEAEASTAVGGVAAVLLEVIDEVDPIEVGNVGTYLIRVTNQGSTADTDVQIVCLLEEGQSLVGTGGPTEARAAGAEVRFAPLPRLGPKEVQEWKVRVKAEKAGDIRFRAELTSGQLQRPVHETEATTQY